MTVKLRPHHLLCIQKFTGHGYDERFTAHMTALVARLRDTPDTEVALVRGCDALCAACPNDRDGACASPEKVEAMDAAVLAWCGLAWGAAVPWAQAARLARERIFQTDGFEHICACCQWFGLCAETEVPYDENGEAV